LPTLGSVQSRRYPYGDPCDTISTFAESRCTLVGANPMPCSSPTRNLPTSRVNAVAPGVIDTDMSNFTKTEAGRTTVMGMQSLKRIGQPDDVASVVEFLASDAARWITGDIIAVDGGSKL
jgi:Enoyl-(Acyl carrier protein) reductase